MKEQLKDPYIMIRKVSIVIILLMITGCKSSVGTKQIFPALHDFNITAGNEFLLLAANVPKIKSISTVDVYRDSEFRVNGKVLSLDSLNNNINTAYSKFATENNINKNDLKKALEVFSQIHVSEFIADTDFFLFPVQLYALSRYNGYLYKINPEIKAGDTIRTSKGNLGNGIVLKKQVDTNWFQYESEK